MILLEDVAALLGLVFAFVAVSLMLVDRQPYCRRRGHGADRVLLVVVAVTLAVETKSLLLGEAASPEAQARIADALRGTDGIET